MLINFNQKKIGYCQQNNYIYPKYAPTNVKGTLTPNHIASRATKVENGTAAELFSAHKIRFMTKNIPKTTLNNLKSN
jgi:hypothetical protein